MRKIAILSLVIAITIMPLGFSPVPTLAGNTTATCQNINQIFGNNILTICANDGSPVSGYTVTSLTVDENFADIATDKPFVSHMRLHLVKNGLLPIQIDPTQSVTVQTPINVITEIEKQYSGLDVSKAGEPQVYINSQIITGSSFLLNNYGYLYSYWSFTSNNNLVILEIEEPVASNVNIADTTAKYKSLNLTIEKTFLLYLPLLRAKGNTSYKSATAVKGQGINADSILAQDLPFPSWWKGECNKDNHPGSFSRGSYRGVNVCGPNGQTKVVQFFPGAHGEYEWQCAEHAMRYLYLAYGTKPYPAHGYQVYYNYSGQNGGSLRKIPNKTVGEYPQPGDVISFSWAPYGHAAIVTESKVDNNGNGYYKTINQNWKSSTAYSTIYVKQWDAGAIGWLRDSQSNPNSLLQYAYQPSGTWQVTNLSTILGAVAGDPVVYQHDSGEISIFARDTRNHLMQFYKEPMKEWQSYDLSVGLVTVAGDPIIYKHNNGAISLFVRDTSNQLQQFYKDTGEWQTYNLSSGLVLVDGDPVFLSHDNGAVSLFIRDRSNHLQQFYNGTGTWEAFDLSSGLGMIAGDPALYVHPDGSVSLFVRDTDNHLQQFFHGNTGVWQMFNLSSGLVNVASDPVVYSHSNGAVSLFVRDTNNHLQQFFKGTEVWQTFDLSSGLVTIAGDPVVYAHSNGAISLFVRDTNNQLQQFYKGTDVWQSFNLASSYTISGQEVAVLELNGLVNIFTR